MRWGLVPAYSASFDNAEYAPSVGRAQTAPVARHFKDSFASRRCLILMSGFYEWTVMMRGVKVVKQPFYISRTDGQLLVVAGLWQRWEKNGESRESCAILTTEPNKFLSRRHDRMPCILNPQQFGEWLNPQNDDIRTLQKMLKPWRSDLLQTWPVDRKVGSAKNDDISCIQPLEDRP